MGTYFVRRLLNHLLVIFGVRCFRFLSLHLAGDPTLLYVSGGRLRRGDEQARHKLGFDRPLYSSTLILWSSAQRDFGKSLVTKTQPSIWLSTACLPPLINHLCDVIAICLLYRSVCWPLPSGERSMMAVL